MTKKEATEKILERLTAPLTKREFSLVKSKAWFVGKDSSGFLPIFSFQLISVEGSGVEFRPQASIRIDAIETILARANPVPTAPGKYSVTLGAEIGRVTGDVQRWRVEVRTGAELDAATSRLVEAVDEAIGAVFQKYNNLEAIDAEINASPDESVVLIPLPVPRAEIGVVVARLLGRKDVEMVVDSHRSFLSTLSPHDVKNFDDFLSRIDKAMAT